MIIMIGANFVMTTGNNGVVVYLYILQIYIGYMVIHILQTLLIMIICP